MLLLLLLTGSTLKEKKKEEEGNEWIPHSLSLSFFSSNAIQLNTAEIQFASQSGPASLSELRKKRKSTTIVFEQSASLARRPAQPPPPPHHSSTAVCEKDVKEENEKDDNDDFYSSWWVVVQGLNSIRVANWCNWQWQCRKANWSGQPWLRRLLACFALVQIRRQQLPPLIMSCKFCCFLSLCFSFNQIKRQEQISWRIKE